jgi:hypothetical protein
VHQALRRNGLVAAQPPRKAKADTRFERDVSNDLWQIDAKRDPRFVEDEWIGHSVKIGDELTLERITPAARCKMISVEQPGLPADDRILQAIAREHRVKFPTVGTLPSAGIFAEVATPGAVRLTDEITIMQSSACG